MINTYISQAPALEMAQDELGFSEAMAWVPAAIGFLIGALFVWAGDQFTTDDQLASFTSLFPASAAAAATGAADGRKQVRVVVGHCVWRSVDSSPLLFTRSVLLS